MLQIDSNFKMNNFSESFAEEKLKSIAPVKFWLPVSMLGWLNNNTHFN